MNRTVQHLKYEIRTIEAWHDGDGWYYNQTWHVDCVEVRGEHVKEELLHFKRKNNYVHKQGSVVMENVDGSMYELVVKKTGEPLMAFIPNF